MKTCRALLNEVKILLPIFSKGQGARTDLTSVPQNNGYSAIDFIAEKLGLSRGQIGKLLVIDKHNPELVDLIDRGTLTISQAHLQTTLWKKERDAKESQYIPFLNYHRSYLIW